MKKTVEFKVNTAGGFVALANYSSCIMKIS